MRFLLWLLVVLTTAAGICGPISDPDLWWHLVVGSWIIHNGTVPEVDLWNAFAEGLPWRAYSWSNEVLYAWTYSTLSVPGLLVLKFLLAAILAASLALIAGKIARDFTLGLLLAVVAAIGIHAYFGLRPQVTSWLCFAWLLYLAELRLYGGFKRRLLPAIAGIGLIWANSHLSLILGFAAAVFWLVDLHSPQKTIRLLLSFLTPLFIGSLITPYLGGEWLTFFEKAEHPFAHMYIQEFQPATLYHAAGNSVLLLFALLMMLLHHAPKALPAVQLCGAVVFLFLALTVQKFIPYAAIYQAFLIARLWRLAERPEQRLGNVGRGLNLLLKALRRIPLPAGVLTAAVLVLLSFGWMREPINSPLDQRSVAKQPIDFIQANRLELPILNTFNDGGYLLFRYSNEAGEPGYRVPIDGRTNVNNPEAVSAFLAALHGKPNWHDYFALVEPQTVLWDNNFPLVAILLQSADWCHVFPPPAEAVTRSRWSVFVSRTQFEQAAGRLSSRNCSFPKQAKHSAS